MSRLFPSRGTHGRLRAPLGARRLHLIGLAAALLGVAPAAPARADGPFFPRWPSELQHEVTKQYKNGFSGELMLYVEDVSTGVRFTHNAATPAYLASVVKLAFMVELMRQVELGKLNLDAPVMYSEDDVRDGSPVFNYIRVGTAVPLRVVLEAMIQQSDNAASDLIAKLVGIRRVNEVLKEIGHAGFGPITSLLDVRRLVYRNLDPRVDQLSPRQIRSIGFAKGGEARVLKLTEALGELPGTYTIPDIDRAFQKYYEQGYNTASMEAVGVLLWDLAKEKLISKAASQLMLEVMLGTTTGARRIVAYLPPGTPVAHKTGTQYQRICDVGLVYVAKHRPVTLAACVNSGRSRARAEEVIARVARRTYELLSPHPLLSSLPQPEEAAPAKKRRVKTSTASKRKGRQRGESRRRP